MDSYLARTLAVETPRHIFELILSIIELDQVLLNVQSQSNRTRAYRSGEFYPYHLPFGTQVQVETTADNFVQRTFAPETPIDLYPGVEREIKGVFGLTENTQQWQEWHQVVVNAALLYRRRVEEVSNRSVEMDIASLYRTFDARLPEHALKAIGNQIYRDDAYFKKNPDAQTLVRPYVEGEYYPYQLPVKTEVTVTRGADGLLVREVAVTHPLPLYPTFEIDNPDMVAYVTERSSLAWHDSFRANAIPYLITRGWISPDWELQAVHPFRNPS